MSSDANGEYSPVKLTWKYRNTITFNGYPYILFEGMKIVQFEDDYGDARVDGTRIIPTGRMKLEPLEETLSDNNKQEVIEAFNSTSSE